MIITKGISTKIAAFSFLFFSGVSIAPAYAEETGTIEGYSYTDLDRTSLRREIVLHSNDLIYSYHRGGETIHLAQSIRKMNPRLWERINRMDLNHVEVEAAGYGTVQLAIKDRVTDWSRVDRGRERLYLHNDYVSSSKWQLILDGRVRIYRVTVYLRHRY